MPDDERKDWDGTGADDPSSSNNPSPRDGEMPASVEFTEMMRQAAARSRPKPPPWADPGVQVRRTRRPQPTAALPEVPGIPVTPAPSGVESLESSGGNGEQPAVKQIVPSAEREGLLEAQRFQRAQRRSSKRRRRAVGVFGGFIRSALVVVVAAALMATIFTWWTPTGFISSDVRQELSVAMATSAATAIPTNLPTPNWLRKIGVVSGHRGPENDPGAVCDDGLKEAEINFDVAQRVVRNLRGRGYTVELLDEFDPRLDNYQAAALVSIHSNTCQVWDEVVSGFLVSAAAARVTARGNDDRLVECVADHYAATSHLQRRDGLTVDMTDYHTFREIHAFTPAAIIELGFMRADRQALTEQPDALAQGITDGVLCYLEPSAAPTLEATLAPDEILPTLPPGVGV